MHKDLRRVMELSRACLCSLFSMCDVSTFGIPPSQHCLLFVCIAGALLFSFPTGLPAGEADSPSSTPPDRDRQTVHGRWRVRSIDVDHQLLTTEQIRAIRKLQSIGYLAGSQLSPDEMGVTKHHPAKACRGLNLVVSGHGEEAILMDMYGEVVHRWTADFFSIWPDYRPLDEGPESSLSHTYWRRAQLMPDGGLLVIYEGIGLVRLDRHSRVVWARQNGAHHDMHVARDGRIYVITRKAHIKPTFNPRHPILEDFITILSSDGQLLREVSILECLRAGRNYAYLDHFKGAGDILHSNTLELLGDGGGQSGMFPPGSILLAVRELDLICVLDIDQYKVLWAESGLWLGPHQPTMLENGHLLVLDNLATPRHSRVLEVDPRDRSVAWSYGGSDAEPFFTPTCGSCQRLPNGNTLITETDPGRAFEVTPEGEIVWEYINPYRAGPEQALIASLFEVVRFPGRTKIDWDKDRH